VHQDEAATTAHIAGMTGLAVGMAVVSCCLWYYSRRYVGEMALLMPDAQRVRFSVLDFWGNREVRRVWCCHGWLVALNALVGAGMGLCSDAPCCDGAPKACANRKQST
jgi:hypothetical protein